MCRTMIHYPFSTSTNHKSNIARKSGRWKGRRGNEKARRLITIVPKMILPILQFFGEKRNEFSRWTHSNSQFITEFDLEVNFIESKQPDSLRKEREIETFSFHLAKWIPDAQCDEEAFHELIISKSNGRLVKFQINGNVFLNGQRMESSEGIESKTVSRC